MSRGLVLSIVLHAVVFFAVLLGPAARPFHLERMDAIAVDLVSPAPIPEPEPKVVEPAPEAQKPPPAPTQVEPETKPVENVKPPEPEPVKTRKPVRRRVFRPVAPKRDESEPSLEERLRSKLEEVSAETPETMPENEPSDGETAPAEAASSAHVEADDFPYDWYLNQLRRRITDSWDPPGDRMLAGRSKRVLVKMRVHRDGRVSDVIIESASGTPGLDASARRAVDRAQPFPPLPPGYAGDVLDVGVRFTVSGSGS